MAFGFQESSGVGLDYLDRNGTGDLPDYKGEGLTISFWYYHDMPDGGDEFAPMTLFSLTDGGKDSSARLRFYFDSTTNAVFERYDSALNGAEQSGADAGFSFSSGTWYHIVIQSEGANDAKVLIDGAEVYKISHGDIADETMTVMQFGAYNGAEIMGYGRICDVKVYDGTSNTSFTGSGPEVTSLMWNRCVKHAEDWNLWTWLPLIFEDIQVGKDNSGNGRDFTPAYDFQLDTTDPHVNWMGSDDDDLVWSEPQPISPNGIASAEAFGSPALVHRLTVTGIGTAEALGSLSLAHQLGIAGIASSEALGALSLAHQISIPGIASGEVLGSLSVVHQISVPGIGTGEAFGTLALVHQLTFTGIGTAEALGSPSLAHQISIPGIGSAEALGTPEVQHRITIPGIASAEALGTPSLALLLTIPGIASDEGVGTPDLIHRITIVGIPSAEGLGIPTVRRVELGAVTALALRARIGQVLAEAGVGADISSRLAAGIVEGIFAAGETFVQLRLGESAGPAQGGGLHFRAEADRLP